MTKNAKHLQTASRLRPGEGDAIHIQKIPVPQADGSVVVEVGFDLGDVPVPTRRYTAEAVAVLPDTELVRICFGQKEIVGQGLRSLLVLNLTPDHVEQFLGTCEQFWPTVQSYVERDHVVPIPLTNITKEPEQVVSMAVNLIAGAFTGRGACLDCYHLSPFVSRNIHQRDEIALDPVVRVDLPTALLFSLMRRLFEIRPTLRSRGS